MTDCGAVARYARRIVERDAHVSWTLRQCARHVSRRMRRPLKTHPRELRHAILRACLEGMKSNRELYAFVRGSV